jgi:hypothetical protein
MEGRRDFEVYLKLLVQIAVCVFSKPPKTTSVTFTLS